MEIVRGLGFNPSREGPSVEAYAVAIARSRDAQRRIDREGLIVADEKGRPIPHPALVIERNASSDIKAWEDRFRRSRKMD